MKTLLVPIFAAAFALCSGPTPAFAATFQSTEKGTAFTINLHGESAELLRTDERAQVTLQIQGRHSHDHATHRPAVWISPRLSEQVAREVPCREKVKRFASGRLADRAEIDLTAYLLVTLNDDGTISFINPHVALNRTKLESLIVLPAKGLDWAQNHDGTKLAVTMPDAHAVAVIDTEKRTIAHLIETGPETRPTRILRDASGSRMWVGLDRDNQVVAIDVGTGRIVASLTVGAGLHTLAQSADGAYLFASNSEDGTVSIIETKSMRTRGTVRTGQTPLAMAWSVATSRLYVAHVNEDTVAVLDPVTQRVVSRIETARGGMTLQFDPRGTIGLLLRPHTNTMSILDTTTQRALATGDALPQSDDVLLTDSYAYVRSAGSEKIRLYALTGLRRGEFNAIEVQAGQAAQARLEPGVADMMAPIPGGGGVIVTNPADRQLYFYHEGMMAMSGAFQTYSRAPRGLLVLDLGLKETSPGTYEATIHFEHGGLYDLAIALNERGQVACYPIQVEGPASPRRDKSAAMHLEVLDLPAHVAPGQPLTLTMRLTDPHTNKPVPQIGDLQVLMIELPGAWQQKIYATPKGDGLYEARVTFPHAGRFTVTMGSASLDVPFAKSPVHTILVRSSDQSAQQPIVSRGH